MKETITLSMREVQRMQVLEQVVRGALTQFLATSSFTRRSAPSSSGEKLPGDK